VVAPSEGAVQGELHGSLASLLARPVAQARGAAQALCGARTISVEKISLDLGMMEGYLRVTPAPARSLIERLAGGESPRAMLLGGEIDPWLLEDVLVDLAVRGVVKGVRAALGEELLGPAVETAHAVLQGLPRRSLAPKAPTVPPPSRPLKSDQVARDIAARKFVDDDDALPSSLADAVMRELRESSSKPPPIVAAADLKKRSGTPSKEATEVEPVYEARVMTPSSPDAETLRARVSEEGSDARPPSRSRPGARVERGSSWLSPTGRCRC
jgi:hypothetical protein